MCHVVCIQVSVIRANWTPLYANLHEVFNLFWLFENAIVPSLRVAPKD